MFETKANFFWQGPSLSIQEFVCISSFVKQNFEVDVYTYNAKLALPEGARRKDAAEILPESELTKYTHDGMPGSVVAFSDAFRYNLLKKRGGW